MNAAISDLYMNALFHKISILYLNVLSKTRPQ
jgi:hypothetical protein